MAITTESGKAVPHPNSTPPMSPLPTASHEQKIWIDSETFDWEFNPTQLKSEHFKDDPKFTVDYCRIWQRTKPVSNSEQPPNLIGNQGFEDDLNNWVGEGEITKDAYLGKTAAKLTRKGKIQQTISVKPNTIYVLSAMVKLPATDMKDVWTNAHLNVAPAGGEQLTINYFKPEFTRKSLEFTTGPETTKATIWLTNAPKSHPVVADHFELVESSASAQDGLGTTGEKL